jgi:cobalt-zinc-cadmium efflux system outer membrane protein
MSVYELLRVLRRLAPALAISLVCSVTAPAAELALRDALSRTIEHNPDLSAYAFVLRAQDARIQQSQLRPNPTLNASVDNALGTGATRGLQSAEITLGLSQWIDLGPVRSQRVAIAQSGREVLEVEGEIRRLDLLAETVRRFVTLASLQESHQLTHLAVELAERTLEVVEARVTAARSPLAEGDRAAVALERALIADRHAEHELAAARIELAAMWGSEEPDFEIAMADLFILPAIADLASLRQSLEGSPDITRYFSEHRLRDSELRLAMASRRAGFEVGAGITRLQDTRDTALMLSFSMPLPVFDRNEGGIAEARALSEGADADRGAALLRARTRLGTLFRELLDLGQAIPALRDVALPRMEEALRNTEYAYERGRYSYLELVDAQRELLALRRDLITAATEYHLTLIELERLTGTAGSR